MVLYQDQKIVHNVPMSRESLSSTWLICVIFCLLGSGRTVFDQASKYIGNDVVSNDMKIEPKQGSSF
jgi:hypothetical protein